MSLQSQTTVTCPGCKQVSPFGMFTSLNVTLDPAEKARLLAGELFLFTCPGCTKATNVTYSMLYHDMKAGLMIYLVPGGQAEMDRFYKEQPNLNLPGVDMSKLTTRLVTSFYSLRDKILCFDAGLDDRLLEITKLVVKLQNDSLRDSTLYFEGLQGDSLSIACVSQQGVQGITVPKSGTYTWMANKLGETGLLAAPMEPWEFVQERWASWAIKQAKEGKGPQG